MIDAKIVCNALFRKVRKMEQLNDNRGIERVSSVGFGGSCADKDVHS